MAKEIERKFLVANDGWRDGTTGVSIRQGYLARGQATVRVRLAGERAWLTVKGPTAGLSRDEFEYSVPVQDARQMLDRLCGERIVHKTRYRVGVGDREWVVDEFQGANEGLVLAEIELQREDEQVETPDWVGEEVSADPRYTNAALAEVPWTRWRDGPVKELPQ